ncbi:RHS repeat-associated core domain-containing protein [Candidatus Izemoplasma sp. B36]|uniref:RHS repeat-associated core domain-containing protein n=1 Tax=Candidatus Izemoplasma sp. B36 TaxID=3242468 RepID=UPI0035582884
MKRFKRGVSSQHILANCFIMKKLQKVLIVFLLVFMVVSSILPNNPNKVYALDYQTNIEKEETEETEEKTNYKTTTDSDFDISNIELDFEDKSKRTEDTKTFRRVDGTYVLAMYNQSVHYINEGVYEDIDNTLSYDEETNDYENKANKFKIKLPKTIDDNKKFKLTLDDYQIDWTIDNIYSTDITYSNEQITPGNLKELTKINQSVVYNNIQNGVDLEYIISGSKIKENIVLNEYVEDYSLVFNYYIKNLELIQKENGSYVFLNEQGDEIFSFESLYMYDSNNKVSYEITFNVVEVKKDEYEIEIIPNDDFLLNASYPVTIDPTVTSSTTSMSIEDTYVYEGNPQENYNGDMKLWVSGYNLGNRYYGLINFTIPQDVVDKQITYSYMHLEGCEYTEGSTIGIYKNTTDFDADSVSWSDKPQEADLMTDYDIVGYINDDFPLTYVFNITKDVKQWVEAGVTEVSGYTIRDKNKYGSYNSIHSVETNSSTTSPYIEIGFIEKYGIKDYWTYNSQNLSEYTTGYVSDYTGMLSIIRNDISFSTERGSLNLSFAYNQGSKDTDIGYGYGWNISYNNRIETNTSLNKKYLIDYTGNVVYFHQVAPDDRIDTSTAGDDFCYISEDGSRNILVEHFDSGVLAYRYVLTEDSNKLNFSINDGYLESIENTKTNYIISISRNQSDRYLINSINDSVGNEINLTYINNNTLLYATLDLYQSSLSLEEVDYTYGYDENNFPMQIVIYKTNYDSSLSISSRDDTLYIYDNDWKITNVVHNNKNELTYEYEIDTDKVNKITSKYDNKIFGKNDYNYANNETIITNLDNQSVIYKFDDFGHTVNVIDSFGSASYFRYIDIFSYYNPITGDIYDIDFLDSYKNYYRNNLLIYKSNPEFDDSNPVNNYGFEDIMGDNTYWTYVLDSGQASNQEAYLNNSYEVAYGNYSAIITNLVLGTVGHFEQDVILNAGAYTFKAYVKNNTAAAQECVDIIGEDYGGVIEMIPSGNDYYELIVTFGILNDNTSLKIKLINSALYSVYFDNVTITKGFNSSKTNVMENYSFENVNPNNNNFGYYTSDSTYVNRVDTTSRSNDFYQDLLGDYSLEIEGSGTDNRYAGYYLSKYLDINNCQDFGRLTIGAWGFSEGVPTTFSCDDHYERYFRVRVDFLYEDKYFSDSNYSSYLVDSVYIDFDPSIEDWQYAYKELNIPSGYNELYINLVFEYQGEGTVYLDNINVQYSNEYVNYQYDNYGNITKIETSNGDLTEYIYDIFPNYPKIADEIVWPDGTKATINLDSSGRPIDIMYNNVSVDVHYNNYGQSDIVTVGDTEFFTTSTSYTNYSQYISSTTDEFGETTDYYSDQLNGLLVAIENAKGQDTHYQYDNFGKLVKVVSVDNYNSYTTNDIDGMVEYLYDTKDRLWKIVLDSDFYYSLNYDAEGRLLYVTVNENTLMSYNYDDTSSYYSNRISEQTYGNQDAIRFDYNDRGQIIKIEFKGANDTSYENKFMYQYDSEGKLLVYDTYEQGAIVLSQYYIYDASGRLSSIEDSNGNSTGYLYDTNGNLASMYFNINGETSTTNYTHDECLQYDSNNVCISYSNFYDKTELTTRYSTQYLKDFHYEINSLYRLNYILYTIGSRTIKQNIIYDNNTTRILTVNYDFDNNSIVDIAYSYTYDEIGNIVSYKYFEDSVEIWSVNYDYDEMNRLVEEIMNNGDACSVTPEMCYTRYYSYDEKGNMTDIRTYTLDTDPLAQEYYTNNGWENLYYRVTGDTEIDVNETLSLSFNYYVVDYPNPPTPVTGITTTCQAFDSSEEGYYLYECHAQDRGGRLFNLDFGIVIKVGNPSLYEHIKYAQKTDWEDELYYIFTYVYDHDNNIKSSTFGSANTYDDQGNLTKITRYNYNGVIYHHANLDYEGRQLVKIEIYSDSAELNLVATISYKYNDQGYRTSKTIDGVTTNYYLQDDKVLYESNPDYDIIYSYDVDGTLLGFSLDFGSIEEDYFYLTNLQGDITHIIDIDGDILVNYTYDAFGNIIKIDDTTSFSLGTINPYTYRGYRYDSEISNYYLNSRFYNPENRRFINADGLLGEVGNIQSTNMFAYCANNPVMYLDPSGEFLVSFLIGIGVAALIGLGVGAASYTVSELISYSLSGEWSWSWGMFLGSTVGGAMVGVAAFAFPGLGIVGAAGLNGFVSNSLGMYFENRLGYSSYSTSEIIGQSLVIGGLSAITAGITSKIKISGLTGRGSISQVARLISTKFYNGSIRSITLETFGKMCMYEGAYSVFNTVVGGVWDAFETNPRTTISRLTPRMLYIDFN